MVVITYAAVYMYRIEITKAMKQPLSTQQYCQLHPGNISIALINCKPHPGEYEYYPALLSGTAVILVSAPLIVWLLELQSFVVAIL